MTKHDLEKLIPPAKLIDLQLIQNSAARVLTKTKSTAHIAPVLKFPQCLPVSH